MTQANSRSLHVVLPIAVATQSVGYGAVITLVAIYFSTYTQIGLGTVAVALTVSGVTGLFAGVLVGHLGDLFGSRRLLSMTLVGEGLVVASYLFVKLATILFVALIAFQVLDRGANALKGALIATIVPSTDRTAVRARLRAISNIGFAAGTLVSATALYASDAQAFHVTFAVIGGIYVLAAVLFWVATSEVPMTGGTNSTPVKVVVTDLRYGLFVVCMAFASLQYAVIEVGIPLWVVKNTDAPPVTVTILLVTNTALVVLLQSMVGRRVGGTRTARRGIASAGLFFVSAFAVFAVSPTDAPALTVALLITAVTLHTVGEMLQAASSWTLSYDLAPEGAHGKYQGLFGTGVGAGQMVGASIVIFLPIQHGMIGWLILAGLVGVSGVLVPYVARMSGPERADEQGL